METFVNFFLVYTFMSRTEIPIGPIFCKISFYRMCIAKHRTKKVWTNAGSDQLNVIL